MGRYIDSLKFAGGSFTLMPEGVVRDIIDLCHKHGVLVSTGGFIERVLTQGHDVVRQYVRECRNLGFDIIEISAGFLSIPTDDWLRLIALARKCGLKAKPEVGIQFGSGGGTHKQVVQGDAYKLRDTLWNVLGAPATAVVSGLPLVTKPMLIRLRLIRDAFVALAPGAPFVQFTYSVAPPIPKSLPGVSTQASERIWMNLPPARVWVYRKD